MKKMELYKGFLSEIDFNKDDGIFVGNVTNTKDYIAFHGESMDDIIKNFHNIIDEYIDLLKVEGKV